MTYQKCNVLVLFSFDQFIFTTRFSADSRRIKYVLPSFRAHLKGFSVSRRRMYTLIIYSKDSHEALFVNQAISGQYLVVISTAVDTWSLQSVKYEAVKCKWDLCSLPQLVLNKVQWQRLSGAGQNQSAVDSNVQMLSNTI